MTVSHNYHAILHGRVAQARDAGCHVGKQYSAKSIRDISALLNVIIISPVLSTEQEDHELAGITGMEGSMITMPEIFS
jgi:hypothetical protein